MLFRILNTIVTVIFVVIVSLYSISCSKESNTIEQGNTVRIQSGKGKEELLQWFRSNMKYASMFDFMKKREEQINECIEAKIACKWLMGSGITNSGKGYIVSFKDNEFTIYEFPAGKDSDYGITDKDMSFKKD